MLCPSCTGNAAGTTAAGGASARSTATKDESLPGGSGGGTGGGGRGGSVTSASDGEASVVVGDGACSISCVHSVVLEYVTCLASFAHASGAVADAAQRYYGQGRLTSHPRGDGNERMTHPTQKYLLVVRSLCPASRQYRGRSST